ncbi:toprim domain-containing protein [Symbiopectobacterium sp. RP]|uniref:toprim domain-containing protein n=1 Tax=Symbiopectobacterium sp. RP TaxID=3248553 RepID=UPI003D2CAE27
MTTFVDDVRLKASGHWDPILERLGISTNRKESECPHCGGNTRYRFDDLEGRGTYLCSHCGAGTGLDLVMKVFQCSAPEAAGKVAEAMAMPLPEPKQAKEKPQTDIAGKVAALAAKASTGQSAYLASKGLQCPFPILSDGSLLLVLKNGAGATTGAQVIKPDGSKRLVAGTVKKGAFCKVNSVESTETVIIAEGLATALSVQQFRPDATIIAAVDAGNLLPAAQVMRQRCPDAQIIIAADNDIKPDERNTGKEKAESAATAVSGWVTLPPTDHKADWDDYRQKNGLAATTEAFTSGLYQPKGSSMKEATITVIRSGKEDRRPELSQMAASQRGELLAARYGQVAVNPESNTAYCYDGTVWQKIADTDLQRDMVAIFNAYQTPYTPTGIKNAVEAMKLQVPVMGTPSDDLIGFSNGVYDLKNKQFRQHNGEDWLYNHNGVEYMLPVPGENLKDNAPNFYKWLAHSAADGVKKMDAILAALYMVLANRYDWQLFIEITGKGGSGKSIFTRIATLLAGEHNTVSANMKSLDDVGGRAQLVGKRFIILPDQVKYVGEGAGIKAITGGDLVEINPKYEKRFSTQIKAVVIATNNDPMILTEHQGGIARRRVIFPFNAVVGDKDPLMADKIATELPVIIRHLLAKFASQEEHAKTLLTEQRNSQEALVVKAETNSVIAMCASLYFMEKACGLMMGGGKCIRSEPKTYLYHLYKEYLEYYGLGKPLSVQNFSKAMTEAAMEFGREYKTRCIKGVTQTNVQLTDLVNAFLPHTYGNSIPNE